MLGILNCAMKSVTRWFLFYSIEHSFLNCVRFKIHTKKNLQHERLFKRRYIVSTLLLKSEIFTMFNFFGYKWLA